MIIKQLHTITFADNILAATQINDNEILMLTSQSEVCKYKIKEQLSQTLFSVKSSMGYADGGFDINAPTTIYYLDEIVVIVNNYKRHGFIHYPGKYTQLGLWRGEYHSKISHYPIALYKSEKGIPHIIYAEDWNHIQIMNLDTRQVLTADKSLIEVNAEEQHIESCKKYEEGNKLAWPAPYDYFFGQLSMSPDNKIFLSRGWVWGSCDYYTAFNVYQFLNEHRISEIPIFVGEHDNRAACWVDESTVAVTYNPIVEEEEDATEDSPQEIRFYKISDNKSVLQKKIEVNDLNVVGSKLYYNKSLNVFIAISEKIGIAVISLDGEAFLHDSEVKVDSYDVQSNSFLKVQDNQLLIYQLA